MIKFFFIFLLMAQTAWGADALYTFYGFEEQSTLGAKTSTGSPAYSTSVKKSGTASLELVGAATKAEIQYPYSFTSGGAADTPLVSSFSYVLGGFHFRTTDTTPSATTIFFTFADNGFGSTTSNTNLALETDGDVIVLAANATTVLLTITNPLTANTWYFIEIGVFMDNTSSGQVWIDAVSKGTWSSGDTLDSTAMDGINFHGPTTGDGTYNFDNFYFLHDNADAAIPTPWATSSSGLEVFAYQSGKAAQTADTGLTAADTTTAANNWDTCADLVWVATDGATYTVDPSNGAVLYNDTATNGHGPGPSGGAYTVTGTIKGAKWSGLFDRGSGGGSTHTMYYGNSGTTPISSFTMTDPDTDVLRAKVLEDTTVPTSGETFALGFGGAGAQDLWCDQMMGEILHLPADAPATFADVYYVTKLKESGK